MKKYFKSACYIIIAGLLIVSFQNCGSEHFDTNLQSSSGGGATGMTPAEFQALQNQALTVLNARCASCHSGTVSGIVPDVSNITELRTAGFIIPGQPQNSPLLLTIYDGNMPQGGPNMVTNFPQEVNVIRDWIQALR